MLRETIDCVSNVVRRDSNSEKHAKPLGRFAWFSTKGHCTVSRMLRIQVAQLEKVAFRSITLRPIRMPPRLGMLLGCTPAP